ncbi:cysteine--tRNA ligase [Thermodesulfobacteriota bacterium]
MTLRIYNTLTRKKELFEPFIPGRVNMYVCGPTVYDSCHIGHARSVIVFDVIARYLRMNGFTVTYVRNFTDVDDKIINRANQLGIDAGAVAEKYIKEFHDDMASLNVERADAEPRVSEHIDTIIEIVIRLLESELAYQIDGDVYFAVEKFKDYGKLSGRKLEDMMAGARVDVDDRKHNPFDFALWKASKPGEPAWESPWGKGRPGWHIECSAMSLKFLGESFDIHGGGKDLIFPHHENEIAQSEGAFGKPFAKYWIHNGFVNINQEKMSKSLGNFLMIKDIIKSYHPEAVRLFLLSNHYRSPIDCTDKAISDTAVGLDKMYALLKRIEEALGVLPKMDDGKLGEDWNQFCAAMDDDFNTARGIGILFEAVRHLNRILDEDTAKVSKKGVQSIMSEVADILKIGSVIGIFAESPEDYFNKRNSLILEKQSIDTAMIEKMLLERTEARKEKDWATADRIRIELERMNVTLEDRPEGTVWKTKS